MPVYTEPADMAVSPAATASPASKLGKQVLATGSAEEVSLDIIDIRGAAVEINLKEDILAMIHSKETARSLPTLLLYNARGLQLFEDVRAASTIPPFLA